MKKVYIEIEITELGLTEDQMIEFSSMGLPEEIKKLIEKKIEEVNFNFSYLPF